MVLTERFVVNQARASFANLQTARAVKESSEAAVSANTLALEGVRAENSVGTRDVLDVLNAEQELLNSQVALVTAKRDEYVAGFALLAAIGKAEARRSEEHTSELQSLMRISYAVFCLKKKKLHSI